MMIVTAVALAAAQPAPPADAHAQTMAQHQMQHEAMKDDCCCKDMAKGGHDMGAHHADEHGAP